MKNGGWGLSQMIVYTCIILGFLLLATYLVMVLYRNIDAPTTNSQLAEVVDDNTTEEITEDEEVIENIQNQEIYINYLSAMKEATVLYIEQNEIITYDTIPLAMLVQDGYISYLYDPVDNTLCSGYSQVEVIDDTVVITPYINCSNYISEGYEVE